MVAAAFCVSAEDPNSAIYQSKIQRVLDQNCSSCHSGKTPQSAFDVSSFDLAMKGGKNGPSIEPGNSKHSLLVQYLRGEKTPQMPLGGKLPPATVDAIAAAIDAMKPLAAKARDTHLEWLLKKPVAPPVPTVKNSTWVRNPIDAFVLEKLEAKGLAPSAPAEKRALLRRVYFDLIGLPPTPEEVREFQNDASADAYDKVIDKLLADKRYGERWGRHWLDLVRFAESDGFAIDGERPTAWRYRDYVIRSFQKDKPYDQFIKEQIAGDELGGRGAGSDQLIALGFLRMATWEADANFKTQLRQDFLNELTTTTSSVFLGMTVGCARCHDHKYDPIPQRDFYRLQAFFAATKVDERPAPFADFDHPKLMKQRQREFEDAAEVADQEFKALEKKFKARYVEAKGLKPDDKFAADFTKALKDKKDKLYTAEERAEWDKLRFESRRLNEIAQRHRATALAVSDVTPPDVPAIADTYVLGGGELSGKSDKVEPGFLKAVLGKEENAKIPFAGRSSGRRTALAEWIASNDNPLTARVMVNRIWQHHFGEGLVRTTSDFGKNGDRPSHPELLDWLATQFIEKKWSMKAMHKLMLTSNTYLQSTGNPQWKQYAEADPDNRLLWRMNWLRLESEVLRDSMLFISGRLRTESGGPSVFFDISSDVAEGFEFFRWWPSEEQDQRRRTIYAFQRRSVMMPMMEVFDGANMSESCSRRSVTTVAPQAFTLLNGQLTTTEAKHFASRVVELAGPEQGKQIDRAFQLTLGRSPLPSEAEQAKTLYRQATPTEALTRLGTVLFNLNEFLYLE